MAAEVIRYSVPFMENDYPFFGPACDALASKVYYQMNLYGNIKYITLQLEV